MLRCVSPYRATVSVAGTNVTLVYLPGETVDDADMAAFLLKDSPGSFELVEERALDAAPADRMMRPARSRAVKPKAEA